MFAIYKRELKAYFHSFIGWLFIAAVLFLFGIYFFALNILSGYPSVAYTVNNALFLFLFAVPILTMRILTEERKQKIDQLIYTAPITIGKIVLGKYLAMSTMLAIPVAVMCIAPLIMSFFGTVAFASNYLAILAFFLYGLASIALCMFLSSFTENQVIAAILGFAAMFLSYMMVSLKMMLSQSTNVVLNFIGKVVAVIDFTTPFDSMLNGIFDLVSVFYFLSFIGICLFLTTQVIQKRRYTVSVKNFSVGAYSVSMAVAMVAIVVVANIGFAKLPSKYTSVDLTSNKLFSLTDITKDYLHELDEDITIYVLNSEDSCDEVIKNTLEKFKTESKHINVEFKDPRKNPSFYKKYTSSTSISMSSMIVESAKRYKVVNYDDCFNIEYDYQTYEQNVTGYDGEGQITSAINYVLLDSTNKAVMTEGHNEYPLDEGFSSQLVKQNIDVETVNLISGDISDDTNLLITLAPQQDYTLEEANKIKDYLQNGGNIVVSIPIVENLSMEMPNLQSILDMYNIKTYDGIVIEGDTSYYYQNPLFLLPEVESSTITSKLVSAGKLVLAPNSKGFTVLEDDKVSFDSLLSTSSSAYAKKGIDDISSYDKDEDSEEGPFTIGASITRQFDGKESKAFVFGCPNMLTDNADSLVVNANSEMFISCANQCTDSDAGNVAVPMKSYEVNNLMVDASKVGVIGLVSLVIIPLGLLAAGIAMWVMRRRK